MARGVMDTRDNRQSPLTLRHVWQSGALVLFGALAAVVLVEAGLQIAAFQTWRHVERQQTATVDSTKAASQRRVLCVGDSFTYGEGAASPEMAYPNQLQRLLDGTRDVAGGPQLSWQVINRGWPGRNSSELLQRVPGMLLRERPDYVCILIGGNNRWSHSEMSLPPPRLRDASMQDDDRRWQWRWRTLRFLQLRYAAFTRGGAASAPAGPASETGRPRQGNHAVASGTRAGAVAPDQSALVESHGGQLYSKLVTAKRLLKQSDVTGLATVNRMVNTLRLRVHASADRPATELLLEILEKLRRHQDVIDEGLYSIEKYGKSPALCGRMVEPLTRLGRLDEALSWAEDAVRLQEPGHEEAWIYSARALVHLRMHHYPLSVRDSILSFSIDPDAERLQHALRRVLVLTKASSLKRYVQTTQLSLPAGVQKRVNASVRHVLTEAGARKGKETPLKRKLKEDLRNIVALVRESGAEPILLTYPNAGRGLKEVLDSQRSVASESRVPLVDMEPVFRELLRQGRHDQYFIADQHCNDVGYGIMAKHVADALLSLETHRR